MARDSVVVDIPMDWATLRRRLERGVRTAWPSAPHQPGVLASSLVTSSSPSTTGQRTTRFIILCAARTGSTMLRHMLNSHPDVRCHGEVMTGRGLDALAGVDRDANPSVMRTLMDRREGDPLGFLEDVVLDPGPASAVGFKIKYEELLLPDYAWLLEWLKSHRELRVIHLTRENRLKRLISEVTATKVYGLYNVTSEAERPRAARISLSPEECLEDFARTEEREALFQGHFEGHGMFRTTYEAIVGDRADVRTELTRFLGVSPTALTTPTLKLNPDDLRSVLEDYEALAAAMQGTRYAVYFHGR
jgi:LPS sulfotransferase NodH